VATTRTTSRRSETSKPRGHKASRKLTLTKETLKDLSMGSRAAKGGVLITPYKPITPSKVAVSTPASNSGNMPGGY
jgi:hypothetical protein